VSSKGPVDFVAAHLTFAPGGTTGWHVHPGPVLVIVKAGTVTKYSADCTVNRYSAGQAFVERGPTDVNMVRNETKKTAETLVTFIIPVGAAPIHSVPAPPRCNPGNRRIR
jgi:quercetin dioxygenase-like cupin family protein